MDVDFLLIGQGLAGTALSYKLINSGKSVHIIDQAGNNNCSRIAAGLFNPVTGRKMAKTWWADLLFPEIVPFYQSLEAFLNTRFLYNRSIYRPFLSIEEQNEWMGRSGEEEYSGYIQAVKKTSQYNEVNDPYGGLLLNQTGYVDLNTMMDAYTSRLKERGELTDEPFDEDQLIVKDEGISYKNIKAKALIYANGMGAKSSRFFHWVPLIPNKGEILVVDQDFAPQEIINRGVFRITLPDKGIRVGSTYNSREVDNGPTASAKEEILEKLEKLVYAPVNHIVEHKSGIRPTTGDRKPILGKHPQHANVYMFNGFGAKGVSLVPYFSGIMLDLLFYEKEPPKELNISRFFKYI